MGKQNFRTNERIRVSPIRLIDESNNQVGIINTYEAISRARSAGLDLVEVSPYAEPPVCRIMDYGKWLYEQKRKVKRGQKKQLITVLKEIRLRPKIDSHDRQIKVNHARKFLEKGHKVQFTMLFRGREMIYVDHGLEIMEEILDTLEDVARLERGAKRIGRRMTMVVTPNKQGQTD
ncbi:MAG TPA: translation initiation factor IF-3 [Planctomycetes bacterium]|nr:translation initiation factor IF-3 [Planctomycetota bacterium]HIJ72398.1 translation initiation factor IF-3 [Planctomycetota bacterium]